MNSGGYCLCMLSFQNNHEHRKVTVYVFYQSTVITDIERLLFMCFISPQLSQTFRGYILCVLSVQHSHEQWGLLFMHVIIPK